MLVKTRQFVDICWVNKPSILGLQDTRYAIGKPIDLPAYILNSKSIMALVHDGHKQIDDNLCFFRCSALREQSKTGKIDQQRLERRAKEKKQELENATGSCFDKDIRLCSIPEIERIFHVSINVYNLKEDGVADTVYLSGFNYEKMHLNLYKEHFSYISKFTSYAKRYVCSECEYIFEHSRDLAKHLKTCNKEKEDIFRGGKLWRDWTIFERLEEDGYDIPPEGRFYKYTSSLDFESILVKRDENIRGRKYVQKHVPVTFSVHSNIPGYQEPHHETSRDPKELVDKLIGILLKHQEKSSSLLLEKHANIFSQLEEDITCLKEEMASVEQEMDSIKKRTKMKESLCNSLKKYCTQHIVLSFNGSRYDIPLIKRYLPYSLQRLDMLPNLVINKENSYRTTGTKRFKFLDMTNYLAAGTSLAAFYRAYNVKVSKSIFPYEWFDSHDKVMADGLPQREHFYSILTDKTVSVEEYEQAWEIFGENHFFSFGDYVEYYNDIDVKGMTEAVDKMLEVYRQEGIDLFKEAVSLAGIAQKYVHRETAKRHGNVYFTSIGKEHKHIYNDLRETGISGGPSIAFCRFHEKGEKK